LNYFTYLARRIHGLPVESWPHTKRRHAVDRTRVIRTNACEI